MPFSVHTILNNKGIDIKKIAHLTSVHPRFDTRIFWKECCGLAQAGFQVTLVVADGKGNQEREGVQIVDVGAPTNRRNRLFATRKKVLKAAQEIGADIYHLHDPELLLITGGLARQKAKVIFDAHEDFPVQIRSKPYLGAFARRSLSTIARLFESNRCKKLSAVVAATPTIRDKFLKINPQTVDVNNYPMIHEFPEPSGWADKKNEIVYIGGISKVRGIEEIVVSLGELDDVRLNLAGQVFGKGFDKHLQGLSSWSKVNELGFLDRKGIADVLGRSKVGLVTLHPIQNYVESLPVKLFEYMAAGLPVVASNFPIIQRIIEDANCGICVNPLDPTEISGAIQRILSDPTEARAMGERGRAAILETYNWGQEIKKLQQLYDQLLTRQTTK